MSDRNVSLMPASSLPAALREQWWIPSRSLLAAIEPGRAEVKVLAAEIDPDVGVDVYDTRPVWTRVTERDGDSFSGVITASNLGRAGFRAGDRLTATLDHVFDFVIEDDRGAPSLNEERARFALGKQVLVGLTTLSTAGELIERKQFAGRLATVDRLRGLELELEDGDRYWLPPDVRSLEPAPPGDYRLRSTGQTVRDPDFLFTWTITRGTGAPP
ncbi:MAG: hypothetical protein M3131_02430 [Actinomycetota bacterium]|nr:hypothetical protein [Actinomycetota bacterium]